MLSDQKSIMLIAIITLIQAGANMAILNWKVQFPDQVQDSGGEQTRLCTLACSDALGTVVGAGYLNQIVSVPANQGFAPNPNLGYQPLPQDMWFIYYSGGAGMFSVSINSGVITLVPVVQSNGFVSVAITAAEFNGMYAAPKLLVAAPGNNKLIIVDQMQLVMTFGSADFAAGGVVAAQYDSTVDGAGVLATNSEAAADFFAAASTVFTLSRISGNTVGALPFSTTVNKGIYLSNATQAFTTGNSTFVANINYHVISVV